MSLPARASLAIALAWAGGFGALAGAGAWGSALAGLVVVLGAWLGPRALCSSADEAAASSSQAIARALALALALALLARTLARVVIEVPAALWALPLVAAAFVFAPALTPTRAATARRLLVVTLLAGLALLASLAGARHELAAEHARGVVYSGPIIGVHPRQAVAVRIDGFGPHDIIVDDYVDPPDGLGYDPQRWAARLELELHTIAATHYANGPARARQAYAEAEVRVVDAVVPPAELPAYQSLLGVEVRSGSSGDGSTVEFGCPGAPLGPQARDRLAASRSCPRKYLVDGSTGLGLSPRWPGYTAFVGHDRARLARWFGWPGGDPRATRRSLAVESGGWLVLLVIGGWLLARRRELAAPVSAVATTLAVAAMAALALLAVSWPGPAAPLARGGPTLLAILLVLLPSAPDQQRDRASRVLAIACATVLALLSASPLGGHGDALALLDAIVESLARGTGLSWESSRALAGGSSVVALAAGVGICVHALVEPTHVSERRHTRERWLLGLTLVLALALALRKPGEDLPLLHGAAALLIAATVQPRGRAIGMVLGLACALGALLPLLGSPAPGSLVRAWLGLASIGCLGLGWRAGSGSGSSSASGPQDPPA